MTTYLKVGISIASTAEYRSLDFEHGLSVSILNGEPGSQYPQGVLLDIADHIAWWGLHLDHMRGTAAAATVACQTTAVVVATERTVQANHLRWHKVCSESTIKPTMIVYKQRSNVTCHHMLFYDQYRTCIDTCKLHVH